MKLLITGGAGFIGSAVIRHVLTQGQDSVINIDKLSYAGNLDSLDPVLPSQDYSFYQLDICDTTSLQEVFHKHQPDAVMHLAAESHVDRSIDGPGAFIQTNIVGTYSLLEAARQYFENLSQEKQKTFRFHHVSTDEVYGDLENPDELFTELTPYAPSSPYSASKASSDHLVRAWYRTYGFPILITNCSNNYGPYQFPEKLIPHMILNAIQGKALPVYGDGSQIRDWLYVEDHARALCKVLAEGDIGQTYNIGGLNEKKNLEVVQTLCSILEELLPDNPYSASSGKGFAELIEFVKDRPGHDKRYAIDASKIETELGWKPEENFASGMKKTVGWYLQNTAWWQSILDGSYKLHRLGEQV